MLRHLTGVAPVRLSLRCVPPRPGFSRPGRGACSRREGLVLARRRANIPLPVGVADRLATPSPGGALRRCGGRGVAERLDAALVVDPVTPRRRVGVGVSTTFRRGSGQAAVVAGLAEGDPVPVNAQ